MSLTYEQMLALCQEIKPLIEGSSLSFCAESTPLHYILAFSTPNQKYHNLLICLQQPFLRFHLLRNFPKAKANPFLDKLNHHFAGQTLQSIELLNEDRILQLTFETQKSVHYLVVEFFPKCPNLYVLDHSRKIIASLHPVESQTYVLPPKPPTHTHKHNKHESISSDEIAKEYQEKEINAHFIEDKRILHGQLTREYKSALKREETAKHALKLCEGWQQLQHEGQLLQANMHLLKRGMREVIIPDWENDNVELRIELDPKIDPKNEATKRFQKSKKLKAGIPHQKSRLEKAIKDKETYSGYLQRLDSIESEELLDQFRKHLRLPTVKKITVPGKKTETVKALPFREFFSAAGLKIWVGKSAKDNDVLTFHYAQGSDWWLHAHNVAGSHVVLRVGKNQEPDQDSLKDAIQLALFYSKDKGNGEVCITQQKFVTKFGKGQAGKVHVSKHRVVHATADPIRLEKIKQRKSEPTE